VPPELLKILDDAYSSQAGHGLDGRAVMATPGMEPRPLTSQLISDFLLSAASPELGASPEKPDPAHYFITTGKNAF